MKTYYKECLGVYDKLMVSITKYYKRNWSRIINFRCRVRRKRIGCNRIISYVLNCTYNCVEMYYYSCHHRIYFNIIML